MIDQPGVRLTFAESDVDRVTGDPRGVERVRTFVARIRESCLDAVPRPCHIDVQSVVPPHSGLGSGTQLGLAVARGLAEFAGEPGVSSVTLAKRVGRGLRSAVGVYGFETGGLIVDAGQHDDEEIGALACRLAVPDEWRVLLITPPVADDGLSGAEEEQAFVRLGSMPLSLTNELSRLVLTELLPAVTAGDLDAFSAAVYEYGSRVGQFFSRVQGGTFGNRSTDKLVAHIRNQGVTGIGQTSWGPTLFTFARNESHARQIISSLPLDISPIDIRTTAPLNQGANIVLNK